jgi:alkylation response protein AidB-like acyl-CoA dehydrogenase
MSPEPTLVTTMAAPCVATNLSDTTPMTGTAKRLLAEIRELAPVITARTPEIEAGGRIPLDLIKMLKSMGAFRMFVPRSHGGAELDLPAALETIATLAMRAQSRIALSLSHLSQVFHNSDGFAWLGTDRVVGVHIGSPYDSFLVDHVPRRHRQSVV